MSSTWLLLGTQWAAVNVPGLWLLAHLWCPSAWLPCPRFWLLPLFPLAGMVSVMFTAGSPAPGSVWHMNGAPNKCDRWGFYHRCRITVRAVWWLLPIVILSVQYMEVAPSATKGLLQTPMFSTLKNSYLYDSPQIFKDRTFMWSLNSTSEYTPERIERSKLNKYYPTYIHSSIIHSKRWKQFKCWV